jgi:hypothetical protein
MPVLIATAFAMARKSNLKLEIDSSAVAADPSFLPFLSEKTDCFSLRRRRSVTNRSDMFLHAADPVTASESHDETKYPESKSGRVLTSQPPAPTPAADPTATDWMFSL